MRAVVAATASGPGMTMRAATSSRLATAIPHSRGSQHHPRRIGESSASTSNNNNKDRRLGGGLLGPHQSRRGLQTPTSTPRAPACGAQPSASSGAGSNGSQSKKEISARTNMNKVGKLLRKCGWFGFWGQFALITVSAVMTVFSIFFTRPTSIAAKFSLYLIIGGVAAGVFSTYWTFGYLQLARRIKGSVKNMANAPKKAGVERNLSIGVTGNIVGMGSTLLGMQAVVGFLVAKTLANATANPFLSGGAGSWNPVLALDVFLVQASTNCLLSHFMSLVMNMWLQGKLKSV